MKPGDSLLLTGTSIAAAFAVTIFLIIRPMWRKPRETYLGRHMAKFNHKPEIKL